MIESSELPYGYYDLSNNSTTFTSVPISVEIVPYKAIPIIDVQVNRQIYSRGNYWQIMYKYIAYTILSMPIILLVIGFLTK
jgi:hypothetical protein